MINQRHFSKKKSELIIKYINDNKNAVLGKRLIVFSLRVLFILKFALAIFEIPTFIILRTPLNILAVTFLIPLLPVIDLIRNGAKGFTYVILIGSILRLLFYFVTVFDSLPKYPLTDIYSIVLTTVLLIQFFISLFILVNFDCDTYFSAVQRIKIKVHTEKSVIHKKSKA